MTSGSPRCGVKNDWGQACVLAAGHGGQHSAQEPRRNVAAAVIAVVIAVIVLFAFFVMLMYIWVRTPSG